MVTCVNATQALTLTLQALDLPQGGLVAIPSYTFVATAHAVVAAGLIPLFLPDYARVEDADARARMEDLWGAPIDPHRGLTVVEIMNAAKKRQ